MAETAAAHAAATPWLIALVEHHWLLTLIVVCCVLNWIGEQFNVGVVALQRWVKARRAHQLEVKRLELETARAAVTGTPADPVAGSCAHRNVVQVRDRADNLVAWLCTNPACDEQLPAGYARVREGGGQEDDRG